jgi:ABC-type enterochelin transport system ATPase subunit
VDSVHKRYDIQSILSDVYLKCETNDIIGLLGRNGSENLLCWKSSSNENADFKFVRIDEVVKTKTSDLFNEISYLLKTILSESIISQESYFAFHKWRCDDFYNDEIIQSFSNRK